MTAERDALAELVACKDLKDLTWRMKRDGKPQEEIDAHAREYAERKYNAWAAARAALAAPAPDLSMPNAWPGLAAAPAQGEP